MERTAPRAVHELVRFTSNLLVEHDVPETQATTTAEHMLWADIRGTETHGLVRLPHYIRRMNAGLLDATAEPEVQRMLPAVTAVDGGNGLGHPPAHRAMREAIDGAHQHGVAVATVRNSGHFGAAGTYSAMAAEEGVIGIVMSNAAALMAPTGGAEKRVGNNPMSIAVPFGEFPIVLDMAMSAVAAWNIRMAADRGESIPLEWGLDSKGKPTTDPADVMDRGGLLRPLGDHKGYGLALMIDMLTGVLSGGAFGQGVKRLEDDAPVDASHTCIAISVEAFMGARDFEERVQEMVTNIRSTPLATGATEVLVPGEREARVAREREVSGIAYPQDIFAALEVIAADKGIEPPSPVEQARVP